MPANSPVSPDKALVVFSEGVGNHWLSPLLKPGFGHVWVVMSVGAYWISVDPRLGTPGVAVVADSSFDLAAFYREHGLSLVETVARQIEPRGPLMLCNCVGVTKNLLGIRRPFILTPYQLFQHLTRGPKR